MPAAEDRLIIDILTPEEYLVCPCSIRAHKLHVEFTRTLKSVTETKLSVIDYPCTFWKFSLARLPCQTYTTDKWPGMDLCRDFLLLLFSQAIRVEDVNSCRTMHIYINIRTYQGPDRDSLSPISLSASFATSHLVLTQPWQTGETCQCQWSLSELCFLNSKMHNPKEVGSSANLHPLIKTIMCSRHFKPWSISIVSLQQSSGWTMKIAYYR